MRKLKYHEQKLLKKVDLLNWKSKENPYETKVIRRYHIQERDDYARYSQVRGLMTKLANELSLLPEADPYRQCMSQLLLDKVQKIGLIPLKRDLNQIEKITVSSFCRRRLATLLVKLKMSETMREAVTLIEQGHVRVGTEVITEPAYFVPKNMEDYITWVDSSKIKRQIMAYNDRLDDFDLMQS